jgi:50S ribosomal protein L16 3-hydroxylase
MKKKFLAGLDCAEFMRRYWQKKMLLVRGALREHAEAVTRDDLFTLAQRDDVESRVVRYAGGRWRVERGPFESRDLRRLPGTGWTLLVQGVDQRLTGAARLLREFSFIPYARLDDVMVSYAAPGGGVGPHFDTYDVFLLQGRGTRRWRVGEQTDLGLVRDAPLRILRRFKPQNEWMLDAGDLLYLPPQRAHDGVALDHCITYSIGFRAPSAQELGTRFLEFLQDRIELEGRYADPDLQCTRHPGRIPPQMISRLTAMADRVRWSMHDVALFAGCYLTEPKANVTFVRPTKPLRKDSFLREAKVAGLALALPSRMLVHGASVFINGESHAVEATARRVFAAFADHRELRADGRIDGAAAQLLYDWYRAGYIELGIASSG